ncbi:hypothetical protein [Microbacterium maritypicum]
MDESQRAPIDWNLLSVAISKQLAPSVALEAIDKASARLSATGESEIREAFAAITEGTWWVMALDEQLRTQLKHHGVEYSRTYESVRNGDADGRFIRGFSWARDRLTHQLPFSAENDETPFFATGHPSAVVVISKGFIWRRADQLPAAPSGHDHPERRQAYVDYLEGESLRHTLARASEWFHKAAGHRPLDG